MQAEIGRKTMASSCAFYEHDSEYTAYLVATEHGRRHGGVDRQNYRHQSQKGPAGDAQSCKASALLERRLVNEVREDPTVKPRA